MLAQRERLVAAAAALLETRELQPQRNRAPGPENDDSSSGYPRWETMASSSSYGGCSVSGGHPTSGSSSGTTVESDLSSSCRFPTSRRGPGGWSGGGGGFTIESFSGNRHTGKGEGPAGEAVGPGHKSKPAHNPHQRVWTEKHRGPSQRPGPLQIPSEVGVLGIAGQQQQQQQQQQPPPPPSPLDLSRGGGPGTVWTKRSSTRSAHATNPATKRHCSPYRRSIGEPVTRRVVGVMDGMVHRQASSPALPMSLGATGGNPSPSGATVLPNPPGSSESAALPPLRNTLCKSAQPLPRWPFQSRISSSCRSLVHGVGFSESGSRSASPRGEISGAFCPRRPLGSDMSGSTLNGARTSVSSMGPAPLPSPRNRSFGQTRGWVTDTLEDLSIVDPGPGPSSEGRRRSFMAPQIKQPAGRLRTEETQEEPVGIKRVRRTRA